MRKVEIKAKDVFIVNPNTNVSYYRCPKCDSADIAYYHNYCSQCGSEILWDYVLKSYKEVKK